MTTVYKVTRRRFLQATAGISATGLILSFKPEVLYARAGSDTEEPATKIFAPNVFVNITKTGRVILVVHRSEMGQQVRTSMPMLIAEELEVSLDAIELIQAQGDKKYGNQSTGGSTSVRLNYDDLRIAGAAAREMLIQAAASKWGVDAGQCYAQSGMVYHRGSGRSVGYGEVASTAAKLPVPETPKLKDRRNWKLLGKSQPSLDLDAIVRGQACYGSDLRLDGTLFASIERSPTVRGKLKRLKDDKAKAVRGVKQVFPLEGLAQPLNTSAGVVVVGEHTWATLAGRRVLELEWDHGTQPLEDSPFFRRKLEEIIAKPCKPARTEGNYDEAKAAAARVISATYHGPYLVQAPMEPLACTARFDGKRCEVWAPTQEPQGAKQQVAKALGIDEADVTVNVTLLGGAFGRKAMADFVIEAAQIAKKMKGTPIVLQWTREDAIQHGFYRAENIQTIEATLDAQNQVTGWRHRAVFPTISSTFTAGATNPSDMELAMGLTNMPYRFANLQIESAGIASDLRIGWLRSVCNTFHAHSINCFVDELAEATGKDPVAFRLEWLGEPRIVELGPLDKPYGQDIGRLKGVIQKAAEMAAWGKPLPEGVGHGFASHFSFLSYIAMALKASVDAEGKPRVHEVNCVVDCGTVLNPDTVRAQIEGSVAFGLSLALYGRVTVQNGVVEQSNFDDYKLLRLSEMPEVNIEIIDSDKPPSGIGEPGVPPVAPALANALYRVTGRRLYDLPIVR